MRRTESECDYAARRVLSIPQAWSTGVPVDPATWHHHYDLACVDCGLIVNPGRSTCILWAGKDACTLPLVMRCKACMEPAFPPVSPHRDDGWDAFSKR